MTLIKRLFFVSFSIWLSSCVEAEPNVLPTNTGFVYSGRIDFSQPEKPVLSWPGTSIKARFSGTSLTVWLNDSKGKNYFNVIVDGNDDYPYVIEAKPGRHNYWISETLGEGGHEVEIYKRTEGEEGDTEFLGLELADANLLTAPPKPKHKIEIYGDSITSGMGNEAAINGKDNQLSEKNNYLAWGSISARALDAELHTISQSGIGILVSWFDFTMPDFFDQLSAVGDNHSQWNFSQWTPELVVINLFQNDSWLIQDTRRINPTPTPETIIDAYMTFVRSIRQRYPKAHILCALGSMDATRPSSPWPGYIKQAVSRLMDQDKDTNLGLLVLPFNGYKAHPRVKQQQQNAALLEDYVRTHLGW